MADTRLKDTWLLDEELCNLSDSAWRFFTLALMFCNSQGTDGKIRHGQMRFLPVQPSPKDIVEVLSTGRMRRIDDGYQFEDWDGSLGQSTAAAVQAQREGNAARQREYRQRQKKGRSGVRVTSDVTDHVTRDVTRPRRTGQEGQEGQASTEGEYLQSAGARESEGWAVAPIGQEPELVPETVPPRWVGDEEPW